MCVCVAEMPRMAEIVEKLGVIMANGARNGVTHGEAMWRNYSVMTIMKSGISIK